MARKKSTRVKKSKKQITVEWQDENHVVFHVVDGNESYDVKAYDSGYFSSASVTDITGWRTNSGRVPADDLLDALDRSPGFTIHTQNGVPIKLAINTETGETTMLPISSFEGEGNASYTEGDS